MMFSLRIVFARPRNLAARLAAAMNLLSRGHSLAAFFAGLSFVRIGQMSVLRLQDIRIVFRKIAPLRFAVRFHGGLQKDSEARERRAASSPEHSANSIPPLDAV